MNSVVEHFTDASLEKIEIDKRNNQWIVHIKLPQVLPVAILKDFCSLVETGYTAITTLQWQFYYEHNTIAEQDAREYWQELIWPQLIARMPYVKGIISDTQFENMQLYIDTENELSKRTLESRNVCNLIDSLLNQYLSIKIPSSIRVKSCTQSLENFLAEKQQLEQSYVQQVVHELKQEQSKQELNKTTNLETSLIMGKQILDLEAQPINSINESTDQLVIAGKAFSFDTRALKSGKTLVSFNITDETDSIKVKVFAKDNNQVEALNNIKEQPAIKVRGFIQYDTYEKQIIMMARDISLIKLPERTDRSECKRIELHLHTPMSSMDGVSSVKSLISTAAKWGHKAIAITDHGVVQAFPEAYEVAAKNNIKVIYGVEAYLVNDGVPIVYNCTKQSLDMDTTYVVFDTETTGLSAIENSLTEIAAVKIKGNTVIDEFQSLVKPRERIPEKLEKLTGITNVMVANAPPIDAILKQFVDFIGDATLVAHNASFDLNFVNTSLRLINHQPLTNPVIDTVALARYLMPGQKSYRLDALCKLVDVKLENHHRALFDAHATGKLFCAMLDRLIEQGIMDLEDLNKKVVNVDIQKLKSYHCILLAKNQTGLKNLYKLISLSHIKYFHRTPRIPRSELIKHREGICVGSACEAGELYQAILLNKPEQEIEDIANFYDYLEIQPLGNNDFLVKKGLVQGQHELQEHNRRIYQLGKKLNKLVIATGDVHFLQPNDAKYREILMASKGFSDAADQPPLYLKTTQEMLDEFTYLGSDAAREVVIDNPEQINEQIESLKPFPDDLFTPVIEGADEQIRQMSYQKAKGIYGEVLPKIVEERLEWELESIIGNGFAVIYLISQKIVTKSLSDGYLVGSRGSVGSSFVATMTDITEVNPLPPHYVCPSCKHSIFITDGSIGSGFDLPDKDCPECMHNMIKDGHDIPFETFMGFKGDKVPDIDLNFSGDYQPKAHKYVEELFGKEYVFRAGTISTVADKTAYGFVQKYAEENQIVFRNAEVERLVKGCTGIKRTTGQHPGGQMVIPNYKDVYDFTPIQFPADAKDSQHYTTHFDYHAISGRLLKLDILGHDDPTVIRMLQDITGMDPTKIPTDDELTMSLFSSTDAIGVCPKELNSPVATFAIPEFGTKFVRQMLEDTRPTTFAELVRISGLSHGTDVWLNNAQELIRDKKAVLAEVISTRDDIMVYLIHKGLEPSVAFKIMEKVRKGKGLAEEDEQEMRKHSVPDWYIWSCKQIKYMFPKAHAVAYVLMAVRIAYFKVHHPLAFYATYFTVRADDFDIDIMIQGKDAIKAKIKEIQDKGNEASTKEKNLCTVLEVAYEMTLRGYVFHHIQLYRSDATRFIIHENGLIPPFSSLAGVGKAAAQGIAAASESGTILSIEDLQEKSKISKTVLELLKERGCLKDLPNTNQLQLF
ncbi:PolC-type DNA polymerase III [Desulfuribacillus alkaliarsenatis]|uniref:DNA polymerase III PolC-type n=2 Tax=Desulfuribacillus alkaliarsenatis TaxID=766136 RepID=A0A1E5G6F5_9FIRM|nr:PolC-type DNA polymerase III [Desulfuribacillus alkaliarsenatis]